jgi:hypothetical protein
MFISKQGWTLFNKANEKVVVDELIRDRDGEAWVISGGAIPLHGASTGRVWVRSMDEDKMDREFFPSVFNLQWRKDR